MRIISHRGYWLQEPERNQPEAFHRSFDLGFGTETDVRDVAGELVISHDMPAGNEMTLDDLLELMAGRNLPLAINVKADGLARSLKRTFSRHGHTNWFAFDMAVPDMRSYFHARLPAYTRLSDVEPVAAWLESAAGIWLDSFGTEWFSNKVIGDLLSQGKSVCIVSPELHQRNSAALWQQLLEFKAEHGVTLCTDRPEHAANFFK